MKQYNFNWPTPSQHFYHANNAFLLFRWCSQRQKKTLRSALLFYCVLLNWTYNLNVSCLVALCRSAHKYLLHIRALTRAKTSLGKGLCTGEEHLHNCFTAFPRRSMISGSRLTDVKWMEWRSHVKFPPLREVRYVK